MAQVEARGHQGQPNQEGGEHALLQQQAGGEEGQDAEAASIKLIITGEQYSTILKDTRDLAAVAAGMVDAVLSGTEPEINDTETYNNNVKNVTSNSENFQDKILFYNNTYCRIYNFKTRYKISYISFFYLILNLLWNRQIIIPNNQLTLAMSLV